MKLFIVEFIFITCWVLVSTEEPFCNNKCNSTGITLIKVCYCDSLCASRFNDCCGDSEELLNKYWQTKKDKKGPTMACKKTVENTKSVMIVDECSENWKGPEEILNLCMNPSNSTMDPLSAIPVTNTLTGITYNNYHCAICNEEISDRVFWELNVHCPTLNPKKIRFPMGEGIKYLFYNNFVEKWGFSVMHVDSRRSTFYPCNISYSIPKTLNKKIRECNSDLISECLPTWKNDMIKRMCNKYIDPVYIDDVAKQYRNMYCAICNKVDMSRLSCGQGMRGRQHGSSEDPKVGWNFALLVDTNLEDGNLVGKKVCNSEEVYDPFFKKCRNIVCALPGYELKDGKCYSSKNNSKF